MSVCDDCKDAGDYDRAVHNWDSDVIVEHPTNCGCPCQHEPADEWEKQFSVAQPYV